MQYVNIESLCKSIFFIHVNGNVPLQNPKPTNDHRRHRVHINTIL